MALSDKVTKELQRYTACDISDALLKLKVPGAGFLADLSLCGQPGDAPDTVTIAPASTVLFVAKGEEPAADWPAANIPSGTHWADLAPPGSFVVLRQPDGQRNAVCGGIMALRIMACQARGIVVVGRARDVSELRATGLPIWARGFSTVGAGAASTPRAIQVPLTVDDTVIHPGDVVFADPINGVVVIPRDKVDQVLDLLPKLTTADDKVKAAVSGGMSVQEAFKLHRGHL